MLVLGLALMAGGAGVLAALWREILPEFRSPRSLPVRAVGRAPVPGHAAVLGRASVPAAPAEEPAWAEELGRTPL